ncbi:MAG: hypothetical protein A2W05_03555 [Candidatus Schekmanbacteria bacterium RBG_16_38_10]|uniref:Methyltransferase type 11 domain-containing protein n=1 Tax=Candidatus Schekmanbacteria bacterium RBG_16_38_10 TaxID=1817879 RepID=A0A1F7S0A8_9BACT|nr:MAG: hypothetical protein A2W05_03555 [Candidatus Schekmanbacteria bacterium RBG_16_38_10]
MIVNKLKNIVRIKKEKEELEFQYNWVNYDWNHLMMCLHNYWKKYRYYGEIIDLIQPQGKRILDVGCGVMSFMNLICSNEGEFFGIDPLMDDYKSLYTTDSRVKWLQSKGERLPFDSNYFDVVVCSNVLDHVEKPNIVMQEISRVLKSSGRLLLTVDIFKEKVVRDAAHPHCFMEKDVNDLLKNNFEILFSKKSELRAQIMLYVKKQTMTSDKAQEIIILAEKRG